ncbi:hypothetical protein TNIN_431521 [Trichonephila inaurata madagascariensis]|uniref:Uncharacterized protein n=1 Tax=Trichonephila inaurata madagascariensis TaxID=2747483 RepID=A0A8X6WMZ1_9ARAC|nr:hypothetical protein TNIN_431521 [Trichonephila inaurata madagascariensis]
MASPSPLTCFIPLTPWPEGHSPHDISDEAVAKASSLTGYRLRCPPHHNHNQGGVPFSSSLQPETKVGNTTNSNHTVPPLFPNGMVERLFFVPQTKLGSHFKMDRVLPVVLLGLRRASGKGLHPVLLNFWKKTLLLPGKFFGPSSQTPTPPRFLLRLRENFSQLLSQLLLPVIHLPHVSCTQPQTPHFLCWGRGVRRETPYPKGPFEVFSRTDKHFTIKKK